LEFLNETLLHLKCTIFKDYTFHTSLKGSFFWNEHNSSIRLYSQSNSLFLMCGLITMVSWYQKALFSIRPQIGYRGISSLVLMCRNFGGWFLASCTIFNLIFFTSLNLFCFPLWKVIASFGSIFALSSHFGLVMWPTSAFFYKTCSIFFFILLVNTIGIV
jgi:hypothetical protein